MGEEVAAKVFSREDRQQYRDKVKRNLDVFARMLRESRFDAEKRSIGLEIELNLTDECGDPAMANEQVLERIADDAFVTELGQFNIEINIPPRLLEGEVFTELEEQIRSSLNAAEDKARETGAHMMIVGILPTLGEQHLHARSLSANPRYTLLNEQIFAARGEDLHLTIGGVERLNAYADSIAPEAACTSFQLHQLVHPEDFARHWNAAQAIAGIQLAVGANSPFFFGKELWRETRIALFEQATDTRPEELKAQGVRPRVWFGERWITSIFDLFEENVRFFPALLPLLDDEDPVAVLERGDTPALGELKLHNGTVYRWNRPVVRGRARAPARARREPRAAVRADRRRHARQRRLLLRAGPRAGRPRAPAVDADVVLGRRGQPARGRARGARRARVLARRRRCAGDGAGAAAAAAARARGARALRGRPACARPAARDHRAPLRRGGQRRDLAEPHVPAALRERGARPRRGAAPHDGASTAITCTPTSPCTPGRWADAQPWPRGRRAAALPSSWPP